MGNLFSHSKHPPKSKITDTDRSVLQLKTQRRQLTGQRKRLEDLIARELAIARELLAAKKRERALLALKKKRLREGQLERIDKYLLNVEQVLTNIETAQRQNRLFDALKQGNAALKSLQQEVSVEEVEKLMDDSKESKEYEDRVRQALGEALTAEDDAAVLQELEQLEGAEAKEEAGQLPSVPKAEPVPADAPELSKEEAKLLEELPDAPKTRIPPETVKQPSKEGPPIAQRRAASQEAPLAA
ncbi:hypothetical protein CVIRNUC_010093 [Coccomyxa viridis]|uniref:Charged multivesicular body protein 6 n=1 Tax=Coccomyxa viridis TaxID=1274662 RepID=A0AAV1IIE6_9CHLO|nr:hypothetical protein CVIRNUC_010093 [Coccomyxa viridis]